MDEERSPPSDQNQPPAKRQRTLACQRCRQRKQKCEETRPCSNCTKAGEECLPTKPAPRPHVESEYVRVLEERIAELESLDPQQSLDHIRAANNVPVVDEFEQISPASSSTVNEATGSILIPTASIRRESTHTRASAVSGSSPGKTLAVLEDDDSDQDHLILGLVTSPSAVRVDANGSVMDTSPVGQQETSREQEYSPHSLVANLPLDLENLLIDAYRERAQTQYPFFHWDTFLLWHQEWKNCLRSAYKLHAWQGFFVNVVYGTSLLLLRRSHAGRSNARMFYSNGISLLPAVLEKPDRILHVQAYLLLAMYALHQSSTERIISLASTTMRLCVQQQLQLCETEPQPVDPDTRLAIQIRRRCFWCAYKLDRLVMFSFDLPPSIPDTMITVRTFANIDDKDLLQVAADTPSDCELLDSPHYTVASSSLHILQCRRIQSEICAITLRWDFAEHYENAPEWRIRILAELEQYKSRVQKSSDPLSKGYTSQRWLVMIYHYTLLMLYRPTKESVIGPAGDWSVQASTQACLMFRRTQLDRQIAQPWLGLLVQFQSGITLLYCFWATPPEHRTENYDSLDVPDALRACSNILAIMAERWAKADCLRDVFELLAREIPLVDRTSRPPTRLSEKTIAGIHDLLPQVRALIVHRSILRMIDEMISEDFPRSTSTSQISQPPSVPGGLGQSASSLANRSTTQTPSANINFQLPFSTPQHYSFDSTGIDVQDLDTEGLLSFPGVFNFDSWNWST